MTNLLRKDVPFEWSSACKQAFDNVKVALTTAPVLVMPDYDKPVELIADACGFGIGAALLQKGRPAAFPCRQFSAAERNYGVGEQELLAVVQAMRTWRCYSEGVSSDMFTVVTDHNPLTYLQTQASLSRRQARWSEYLQCLPSSCYTGLAFAMLQILLAGTLLLLQPSCLLLVCGLFAGVMRCKVVTHINSLPLAGCNPEDSSRSVYLCHKTPR